MRWMGARGKTEAYLDHKAGDYSVYRAAFVVQRSTRGFPSSLLARAQRPEVFHSLWARVFSQADDHPPQPPVTPLHIEVHPGTRQWILLGNEGHRARVIWSLGSMTERVTAEDPRGARRSGTSKLPSPNAQSKFHFFFFFICERKTTEDRTGDTILFIRVLIVHVLAQSSVLL